MVLALFLAGTFPPELPDGGAFEAFAAFILVLDATAGAVGGLVGGGLARRVRRRSDAEAHAEIE